MINGVEWRGLGEAGGWRRRRCGGRSAEAETERESWWGEHVQRRPAMAH